MADRPAVATHEPIWRHFANPAFRSALLGSVGGVLLLAGLLWLMPKMLPSADTLTHLGLDWLPDNRLAALAAFIIAGCLLTVLGLPRQNVAMFAGYFFGIWVGVIGTLLAVTSGSALLYELGNGVARPWVVRRFPVLVARIEHWASERLFARVLALRLFPVGSNLAMSLAAGVTQAHRVPFLGASVIGFVPQTLVFAMAGQGVNASDPLMFAIAVTLLILSVIIGIVFGLNKGQ